MNKLKQLRVKNNKTAEELASLLNITVQAYYKYESGKNEPNIDNLIKMADFYHISLDELVGRPTRLLNLNSLTSKEQNIIEQLLKMNDTEQDLLSVFVKTLNKSE